MSSFRLVQLTDLHIFADEYALLNGANTRENFLVVLRQVLGDQPDYIVLTGDISGDHEASVYPWVMGIMEDTGVPWSWLPGNHDEFSFMQSKFLREISLGKWRVLQLNSQVEGERYGDLSDDEIEFLQTSLTKDNTTPTLVMVHHHVCDIGSCLDDGRIKSNRFFDCLASHMCVKAVVHGHIHQAWEGQHAHFLILGTPSTSVQFLPKAARFLFDCQRGPGYRLFDLHPWGNFYSEVRRVEGKGLLAI